MINNVTHVNVSILFNDATVDATDDDMGNIFFNLKPWADKEMKKEETKLTYQIKKIDKLKNPLP